MEVRPHNQRHGVVRVAIVGPDPLERNNLQNRLERSTDLQVIGGTGSTAAAVDWLPRTGAHVVVVDDQLIGQGQSSLCARLRATGSHVSCIVHAALPPTDRMRDAWDADAVVLKSLAGDDLETEIRALVSSREIEHDLAELSWTE